MIRTIHPLLRVAAGLLIALAAACSQPAASPGSPTSGPGGATAQPQGTIGTAQTQGGGPVGGVTTPACDLLTDAEIEDITGQQIESKTPDRTDVGYENHCVWLFEVRSWILVLGIEGTGGAEQYDLMLDYEGGAPVEGVGDRAFMGEVSNALTVLRGDTLIFIQVVALDEADDVEQRLAERVLANLGA